MIRSGKVLSGRVAQGLIAVLLAVRLAMYGTPSVALEVVRRVRRVLILYPYDERIAATTAAGEAVRTRPLEATKSDIDIFSEFLDLSRFPEKAHVEHIAHFLAEKYADRRPDVLIALGEEAASFMVSNRKTIAPGAQVIFAGLSSATAVKLQLPNEVIGAFAELDIVKTLELARSLQPNARHLFIIGGVAPASAASNAPQSIRDCWSALRVSISPWAPFGATPKQRKPCCAVRNPISS